MMAARSTVLCYILLLLSSIIFNNSMGIVTSDPALACPGESITVSCDLSVPNPGDSFLSLVTNFIVGNSVPLSDIIVNGVGFQGGVDLSKLTADSPISNTANVLGTITLLSYTLADNGLRLGCSNDYIVNGDSTDRTTLTETIIIQQAAPPSPPVSLTANLDSTTCSGNVELSWIPGATDRSIQMYHLFINGDYFHSTPSTSYSYYTTLEIDTEYEYSVIAMNCAGNSKFTYTANTISIGVPSSPVLDVFQVPVCLSFGISWDTPSTDRPILSYSVYRDDNLLANPTNTEYTDATPLAINTSYTYSVYAISCVGSSVPGVITLSINAPSSPIVTLFEPDNICSNILISWTTDSDRDIIFYSVYRNDNPLIITADNQYTDTIQLTINTVHQYSVTASSCAGTSTPGVNNFIVRAPSRPIVTLSEPDINCANILISWTTPDSDRDIIEYSVYRDNTLLTTTTDKQYKDTDQLTINTVYQYSVTARSCAGTSTSDVIYTNIPEYSLSFNNISLSYDETNIGTNITWTLDTNTESNPILLLTYSLHLDYSYSQGDIWQFSETYVFSQLSTDTTYSLAITPHNFITGTVNTEITACLRISQCGGPSICMDYDSAPYVAGVIGGFLLVLLT
ncbi:hypothetical protein LOD99_12534 [Oopsacas minuta]|uniref:Fibronectin type-III domain-containing protein n=1 Tax=Oopsacas minuta TaxID=111878 RepID=A0AAV7JCA8_9METZ|nr:hypothetical protein LOD99_12534 [Oopsacas minuta]